MANDMGKLNQANLTPDNENNTSTQLTDMRNTNSDGGRSLSAILTNPDFKPSDLYHDSSNINPETGLPKEAGNIITNEREPINANDRLATRKEHYKQFQDGDSETFTHNLDRPIVPTPITDSNGKISYANMNDIYLGSWLGTKGDNEDPIIFGYDLEIDMVNSPLFNGAIEDFINDNKYSNITEVTSRLSLLQDFKTQFFKFFNANADKESIIAAKAHYFRKITGLDRLINRVDSETKKGQFVDYQKEFIKITASEDVSMNMGYLITLYNNLAWSKINGKMVIPENLLRFNLKLTVTEIRKYERVIKNQDIDFEVIADNVSKHIYTLYECQMFFDKQPHEEEIELNAPRPYNETAMKFNYKFYTHKFEKFEFDPQKGKDSPMYLINNEYLNPKNIRSQDSTNATTTDGDFKVDNPTNVYASIDRYIKNYQDMSSSDLAAAVLAGEMSAIEAMKQMDKKSNNKLQTLFNKTVDELINIGRREMNRRVNKRAQLFNDSMVKYRQMIPGGMGIPAPTNVYDTTPQVQNDLKNAFGNFVGNSIKMILGK